MKILPVVRIPRAAAAVVLFTALVAGAASPAAAQTPAALDMGFRQMYDLDFGGAHRTLAAWIEGHPEDPLGPVADAAAYLFAEFDRLHILQSEFFLHDDSFRSSRRLTPDKASAREFERQLGRAQEISGRALGRQPRDTNALFAQVLASGLRSDYDALIEKKYLTSLTATKNSRHLAEQLLAIDNSYADAWLAVGVENYLLSLKPLPIRWFLQWNGNATDKDLGLAKLRITAEKGHYLQPFARLLLAVAALRDRDTSQGKRILSSLASEFEHNHLYKEELARLK